MILIEKLHKYLNKDSEVGTSDLSFRLPEEQIRDGHIYGKYIMDARYAFVGKFVLNCPEWVNLRLQVIKDKAMYKNSFTACLMSIIMPEYRYFDLNSRKQFVLDLHRQIGYDMEEKSLYKDMGYTRIRKQIRDKFINGFDIDGDKSLMQVLVDYFSLTVYVLSKTEESKFGSKRIVERLSYVPSVWRKTERNEEYLKKNLICLMVEEEGKYYPLVRRDVSGIFSWQDEGMEDIIEELNREVLQKKNVKKKSVQEDNIMEKVSKIVGDLKEETNEMTNEEEEEEKEVFEEEVKVVKMKKKITLAEIQEIATEKGIDIMKKSEKTGKMLKKTIEELRTEIKEKEG